MNMAEEKGILEPEIIFEDNNILAINKPAGLIVHPDGKTKDKTLCDWLLQKYPSMKGVGEPLVLQDGTIIDRPGIVHRIDRWTSGVMLVAKNQLAHEHLKKQFQNREIEKTYYAIVHGTLKQKFGTINAPLGRSKGDFRQYTTPKKARGEMREAITYYEVDSSRDGVSLLKIMPKTGRTHQIRAHMVHIGHPIVGDKTYSKKESRLGLKRMALHAHSISFKDMNGELKHVMAPFPGDFSSAIRGINE